jgi:hypothetical protein
MKKKLGITAVFVLMATAYAQETLCSYHCWNEKIKEPVYVFGFHLWDKEVTIHHHVPQQKGDYQPSQGVTAGGVATPM